MAVFYLMPRCSSYEYMVEECEFGYSQLLADFGSYLGLFLGWSLLSISRDVPLWFTWTKKTVKKACYKCKILDLEEKKVELDDQMVQ